MSASRPNACAKSGTNTCTAMRWRPACAPATGAGRRLWRRAMAPPCWPQASHGASAWMWTASGGHARQPLRRPAAPGVLNRLMSPGCRFRRPLRRVVSFETLEHLENQSGMLAEFERVLAPGGLLLISSPDKAVYSEEQGTKTLFMFVSLPRRVGALLTYHFPHYRLFGQRLMFHSAIWSLDGSRHGAVQQLTARRWPLARTVLPAPMYFLACARARRTVPPCRPTCGCSTMRSKVSIALPGRNPAQHGGRWHHCRA